MRRILLAFVILGALSGFFAARKRYQAEALNRRVEIAVDYAEVRTLAQMSHQPFPAVLARLQAAGVTSVGVAEDTLAGLEADGALHVERKDGVSDVIVASPDLFVRIAADLQRKGFAPAGPDGAGTTLRPPAGAIPPAQPFHVPADYGSLRMLGIGLDPREVAEVVQAHLVPIGRVADFPGASPATMLAELRALKGLGIETVIFQGLEVYGYRDQAKQAAQALDEAGLNYGQVEFGKQKGDDKLSVALRGRYIRVHSIGDAEMGPLDRPEMIDRFVRAARERNIRICYIRMMTMTGEDPVGANADYIGEITRGIARGHEMTFGQAHQFPEPRVPRLVFALIGLGVAAGSVLLVLRLVRLSVGWTVALVLVSAIVCGGLSLAGETGHKLVALLAALVFPTLACLRRDVLGGPDTRPAPLSIAASATRSLTGLLAASAVTTAGILSVVGLLATRPFMLKANQFLGIKAAHALPILLIGFLAIAGLPSVAGSWREEWEAMRARLGRFLAEPARVGPLLVAIVALLALALIVARTGNDPGVGVSGFELKARALMDRFLPVRPRTKEFLVGHPAFVLALALWFRGRRRWALPLFVVGVVGQVSILNTFCHIHTPLILSLVRDVTGLIFGAVLGLAVFLLIERVAPAAGSSEAPEQEPAAAGQR